ncbi:MAG TPA: hypothetical protein VE715_20510 [Blastocatellia bacterium]|nr:hypothetical protein [Blastocatellia bacterium]
MLPHRARDENGAEKIHPGSFSQAFETALDRAQERARLAVQTQERANNRVAETRVDERPELRKERRLTLDELLLEATRRNPSVAGRELIQEIIMRGPEREPEERPEVADLRAAFKTPSIDDSDYHTQPEPAARRLSDTVAHLQEETQQRARVAHQALLEEYVASIICMLRIYAAYYFQDGK